MFKAIPNSFFNIFILLTLTLLNIISSSNTRIRDFYMGIDFGSEFIKASLFNTNNNQINMIENLQTKTKSNNIFALLEEERFFGYEALAKQVRYPNKCFAYMTDFLYSKDQNISYNSDTLETAFSEINYLPYVLENRYDTIKSNSNSNDILFKFRYDYTDFELSLEGILAMQFRFFKKLAESQILSEVNIVSDEDNDKTADVSKYLKGVVLVIPENLSISQREVLMNSIELADLKLIGFSTENDASSYIYGLEYFRFKETEETNNNDSNNTNSNNSNTNYISNSEIVGFINIGSTNTHINYYLFENIKSTISKNTSISNSNTTKKKSFVKITPLVYDITKFGGRNLDYHLLKYFESNYSNNENPIKATTKDEQTYQIKMLPSIIKYKEILSANKSADYNFFGEKGVFKRSVYEKLLVSELNKLKEFLIKTKERLSDKISLLKNNRDNKNEYILNSIELLGGSTRVPCIIKIIEEVFDEERRISISSCTNINNSNTESKFSFIGSRINGDDSPARGAGYLGFNLSKLKENEYYRTSSKVVTNNSVVKKTRYYIDVYSVDNSNLLEEIKESIVSHKEIQESNNNERNKDNVGKEYTQDNYTNYYGNQRILDILKNSKDTTSNLLLNDHLIVEEFSDIYEIKTLEFSNNKNLVIVLKEKLSTNSKGNSIIPIKVIILDDITVHIDNKKLEDKDFDCIGNKIKLDFFINSLGELIINEAKAECEYTQYFDYKIDDKYYKFIADSSNNTIVKENNNNENRESYNATSYYDLSNKEDRIKFGFNSKKAKQLKKEEIDMIINLLYPEITDNSKTNDKSKEANNNKTANLQINRNNLINQTTVLLNKIGTPKSNTFKFNLNQKEIKQISSIILESKESATINLMAKEELLNLLKTQLANRQSSLSTLNKIDYIDSTKEQRLTLRNSLESLIYQLQEKINENVFDKYTTQQELSELNKEISEIKQWFEEDGLTASFDIVKSKFTRIEKKISPIQEKYDIIKKLEIAIEEIDVDISKKKNISRKKVIEKPWLKYYLENEFNNYIEKVEEKISDIKRNIDSISDINNISYDNLDDKDKNNNNASSNFDHFVVTFNEYIQVIGEYKKIINEKFNYYISIKSPEKINMMRNIKLNDLIEHEYSDNKDSDVFGLIDFLE